METGSRPLKGELAERLDDVYGSGGTLTALVNGAYSETREPLSKLDRQTPGRDLLLVRFPGRGQPVPISRRELLAALGIGAVNTPLRQAAERIRIDEGMIAGLESTLVGLQHAGRVMPPARLIRPLTSHAGAIHAVRQHAPAALRPQLLLLQTRAAESLSWMAEEAGHLDTALYWTDRAQHWATTANWPAMVAYTHVRRSMLAVSHARDGRAAVDQAIDGIRTPGAPPRVRAMAAKQMAYGFALMGRHDDSKRALEKTVALFGADADFDDPAPSVGQRSVPTPDLLAIYQATCDVYLGGGTTVVTTLQPHLNEISAGSRRTQVITEAKLAQAYANTGEPALACDLVIQALDGAAAVDSQTARSELRRVLPALQRWSARTDVQEVQHHLRNLRH